MHFGARCVVSPFSDGKNYIGIKLASLASEDGARQLMSLAKMFICEPWGRGRKRTRRYATVPVRVCVIDEE
jgi:hypothetical protein